MILFTLKMLTKLNASRWKLEKQIFEHVSKYFCFSVSDFNVMKVIMIILFYTTLILCLLNYPPPPKKKSLFTTNNLTVVESGYLARILLYNMISHILLSPSYTEYNVIYMGTTTLDYHIINFNLIRLTRIIDWIYFYRCWVLFAKALCH